MKKVVHSKKAVVLAKKPDGQWGTLACVEELTHVTFKTTVQVVGLTTGNWEQHEFDRKRNWQVNLKGIALLVDVEGAWTANEISTAIDNHQVVALKLVFENEDGDVLSVEERALLHELGFAAAIADGGESAKWNTSFAGTGPLAFVEDVTQWLWSSNIDLMWPSNNKIDLING